MFKTTEYRRDSIYRQGFEDPPGRIFVSGQQALVRLLLAQAAADRAAGLNTAGFVSGYRGSPLGGVDHELWHAKARLEDAHIRFQPAINEDLAATALIGTQRVETDATRRYDGVFGMWYGKGPGVDRSGDAIKHGNAYGSSPHGGVLVVTGDDHGCVSSSMSHQSDRTLIAWGLPVIHPSGLADYERCGLWGWALSRASGLWVGFKAITETVEASASVPTFEPPHFTQPPVDPGPDGLHWRWPDLPGMQIERRHPYKLKAARAFMRANPLDEAVTTPARPVLVIAAVGKAYRDVREALRQGGVSLDQLERAGVALLKINVVYPLSPLLETWAHRAGKVFVIEEKQPVVEEQLKHCLYNARHDRRATIVGKVDEKGAPLVSELEELRPSRVAPPLARQLKAFDVPLHIPHAWGAAPAVRAQAWIRRTPYLCSGCPHNTSTRVPAGSEARLGIGCHAMAARMPERATSGSVQMGGEGVDWLGQAPFVDTPHIFQNIGDGTFFHSGYLAIRQAIAAGATITYKLLYNDAVAMTGGQPVDGQLTVRKAAELVLSEGARRVVVVADDPGRYQAHDSLPKGVDVHHRDQLDDVQRQLRDTRGVSVLIFDQVCATEARRRKKRQPPPAVQTRVVINEAVCEGCGDCQVKSNCLSVVPVDTPFGLKRAIDAHSCNTDLSCVKGFCPSFVTVTGRPRERRPAQADPADVIARADALAPPKPHSLDEPFEIMLVGVGGTGVVTVANAIGLAAHLDRRAVSVLDFTGFAQKGGAVLSHIRIAREAEVLHQYRIDRGGADALLAADLLVATEDDALASLERGKTLVIANTAQTQTGAMLRDVDARIETDAIQSLIEKIAGAERYDAIDAKALATELLDPMQANMLLFGYAWQRGAVPVSLASLRHALSLQGGQADAKYLAFSWGRLWAANPAFVAHHLGTAGSTPSGAWRPVDFVRRKKETIDELIESRSAFLTQYQDARYAARYRRMVERVRAAAAPLGDVTLVDAVARMLFKLMAYKDEYEVARLHTSKAFLDDLRARFDGRAKLTFHLAPPALDALSKQGSRPPRKRAFSRWMIPALRVLAAGRVLRHTPLDPFGWMAERRDERRLVHEYEETLDRLLPRLSRDTLADVVAWAKTPDAIRGYGYVKAGAIVKARERQAELVERILGGHAKPAAAPVTVRAHDESGAETVE
ncbi:indolepyruvate ferredoxin oxidoreductase family protein [Burkholderia oklahomensis]|uniref:Pyruvate ferredoxin/flavodoxin oxidoreductase family protein n=1 Tax=Burkholderia oklahomensis TaxID=342113 RepID=A0AAI8FNM8_9BURK|nr:indolepyruvate ferredoxin oxidoreductase family protein [Burkholderia oklahomensis]AIO66927.1 pyruvate ferredoxin/flavodoxin oxidoreductase family protein [Burkholderia oklahomensis]AOI42382.1 2-oxoacid ferredoxin oxidoreductase [Burkholderia oklahomensis EO147]KUY52692.1 2-oxoacid ferredoxin oxidoreductase [Burkholderia oklahomensis EO147]QPS37115.1 indolepyruvate ferredoxin oxidoreductase family protein [Burkholderia oklahomensis]